jgi:hypothetical protein
MKVLFLVFLISIQNSSLLIFFFSWFCLIDYPNDIYSTNCWNIDFKSAKSSSWSSNDVRDILWWRLSHSSWFSSSSTSYFILFYF